MTKYHINPETGRANICRAVNNCAFNKDGKIMEHYDTRQEAQDSFEKQNSQNNIRLLQKQTKATSPGRMSKEEYHRLQEEKGRKRKLEREAENRAKEKEAYRKKELRILNEQRTQNFEELEKLSEKEEELKNDKKRVKDYMSLLNRKSAIATSLERKTAKIREFSKGEDKDSARLRAEDTRIFERETYQDELRKILELRAEIRKRIERNPFAAIKKASADMRGVLTNEQSTIRSINRRIYEIIGRSYIWRVREDEKIEWLKFEKSIDHLFDHDEK